MQYLNKNAINWLEKICSQRFGICTKIIYKSDTLALSFKGTKFSFVFNLKNSNFEIPPAEISYFEYDARRFGLNNPVASHIPIIGLRKYREDLIIIRDSHCEVNFDFLGMVYFTLGRIEELQGYEGGAHSRFPYMSSHAYKYGYIERPFIDEWFNIFCQILCRRNILKEIPFCSKKLLLSHDVDRPAKYAFTNIISFTKTLGKDLINGNLEQAFFLSFKRFTKPRQLIESDPYNTFDYLMNISEQASCKSTFYFLAGKSSPTKDADYFLHDKDIEKLMRKINERGHYIGLHPSYNSYLSAETIKKETTNLVETLDLLKIKQDHIKARMHYLKFRHPYTYRYLVSSGIQHNSTMGYAEHIGFRAGTCWPYPVFDPLTQQELQITESPLIAMDVSLYGQSYMGIRDMETIMLKLTNLYDVTNKVGGRFEFLWHNSNLTGFESIYEGLVRHSQ